MNTIHQRLAKLEVECGLPGWDGEGADRVSPESVLAAQTFLSLLPAHLSCPDPAVDPDGDVAMDWNTDDGTVSISISAKGMLSVAWCFGQERGHFTENFGGREIPKRVLDLLDRFNRYPRPT